jgi:2-polyprenyl-3-methyl-5-hydroxy-6-metoxy-1,4-benzoquinol methylase
MEHKLFSGDVAEVSTFAFHEHRERAAHLEQPAHRARLLHAAELIGIAVGLGAKSVSDLGCGDGGLLSLLKNMDVTAWGYDFTPANKVGWAERGVTALPFDVFGADRGRVTFGNVTAVTEVLEHVTAPHDEVRWIAGHSRFIVASSPWNEGPDGHDECHAWCFDVEGYRALIEGGGFRVLRHDQVGQFQLVLGMIP